MNKKNIFLIVFVLILISLSSILITNNFQFKETTLSKEELFNYTFKARQANISFKYKEAHAFYKTIINSSSKNEVLEEYLFFLVAQRDFNKAFDVAQQVVLLSPRHYLGNLVLISYFIKNNQLEKAINHLQSLNPDKESIHEIIMILLEGLHSYKNNNTTEFENKALYIKELAPDLYYYDIGLFNLYIKDYEKAKEAFNFVNNSYPNIESVVYLSKILYKDNQKNAIEYFQDYLSDNFLSSKQTQVYIEQLNDLNIKDIYSDILLRLSILIPSELNETLMTSNSFILSNLALMVDDKNNLAKISIANFYESLGDYDSALDFYISIDNNSFYKRSAMYKILDIYTSLSKDNEAITMLKQYSSLDRDNPIPMLELGRIYDKQMSYKKAISFYEEALDVSMKNKYVLGTYLSYYYMGVSYDRNNQWDIGEKKLLLAMEINNQDPLLVNYLAYSWIIRDKNIKESLKMLSDALKISPTDSNILDSYAWGLFKNHEYKKALSYSQKAHSINPYDDQINDHLGDLYYLNKNKEKAIFYWKASLNLTQSQELKDSLVKKINNQIPNYLLNYKKSK